LKKLIIAIDGTAGSGKSTTAKLVAHRLDYLHIDTGAMYRAVALAVLQKNIDPEDAGAVEELTAHLKIRLRQSNGITVLLNDDDVTDQIRSNGVTAIVSRVSSYGGVRNKLAEEQREMGRSGGVVLEGRDIGTVIFPEADVKLFFTADIEERARRRLHEMAEKGEHVNYETMIADLELRDQSDTTRKISPLKKADDAITIDTSHLSIDEQVEKVLSIVSDKQMLQSSVKE
jgi:CMP/dCMP kinase